MATPVRSLSSTLSETLSDPTTSMESKIELLLKMSDHVPAAPRDLIFDAAKYLVMTQQFRRLRVLVRASNRLPMFRHELRSTIENYAQLATHFRNRMMPGENMGQIEPPLIDRSPKSVTPPVGGKAVNGFFSFHKQPKKAERPMLEPVRAVTSTLSETLSDPSTSMDSKIELVLRTSDLAPSAPRRLVFDAVIYLLSTRQFLRLREFIRVTKQLPMLRNRLNALINSYALHLTVDADVHHARTIIAGQIIDFKDVDNFVSKVASLCLSQGWLEEGLYYIDYAEAHSLRSGDLKRRAFFAALGAIFRCCIDEAPLSTINQSIRDAIDAVGQFDNPAAHREIIVRLVSFHFAENEHDFEQLERAVKALPPLARDQSVPATTMEMDWSDIRNRRLLAQDHDFAQRLRQAVEPHNLTDATLIFCSGAYIQYFEIFWKFNRRHLGKVVIVSIDDEASRYFSDLPDIIHVNETIYNEASDFTAYLWRKRLEAVRCLLHLGINVFLCGVDSIFIKNPIALFSQSGADLVAGNGPGLPFSAIKSHRSSMNCDSVFFRGNEKTARFIDEVVDRCGVFLTDQSSLNISTTRNGTAMRPQRHQNVPFYTFRTKYDVNVAVAVSGFMVRSQGEYDRLKGHDSLWIYQPSDKKLLLVLAEQEAAALELA